MCKLILIMSVSFRTCANRGVAPVPSITHATFAQEGPLIMSRGCFTEFIGRSVLQIASFITRQIPQDVGVRVDSNALLASISFVDEEGSRRRVRPWIDGPGWRNPGGDASTTAFELVTDGSDDSDQTEHIQSLHRRWERFAAKQAGHIPYAVAVKKGIHAIEGWDSNEIHKKMSGLKNPNGEYCAHCIFYYLLSFFFVALSNRIFMAVAEDNSDDSEDQDHTSDNDGTPGNGSSEPRTSSQLREVRQNKRKHASTPVGNDSSTSSGRTSGNSLPRQPSKRPRQSASSKRTSRGR